MQPSMNTRYILRIVSDQPHDIRTQYLPLCDSPHIQQMFIVL